MYIRIAFPFAEKLIHEKTLTEKEEFSYSKENQPDEF